MEISPDVPPKPSHLPKTPSTQPIKCVEGTRTCEENSEDTHTQETVALYRHSFSRIPVIGKITFTLLIFLVLLYVCIYMNVIEPWIFLAGYTIVAAAYSYYIILRWNGEEFIVNDDWYEKPRMMPAPFSSRTPAIRKARIGSYTITQTWYDKIFNTCQLHSDTPSEGDEEFHDVKWLTHPEELRKATGISAPKKNSYFIFGRKK